MTEAQKNYVAIEKRKEEVLKYYEELENATQAVNAEIGVGGSFQDDEGTVYMVDIPTWKQVKIDHIEIIRTRREGEKTGKLSMKKAEELGYIVK